MTEGEWVKYPRNSDHMILFNSLYGKGTGWCTASGEQTANIQLLIGDFFVYYTKDDEEKYTIPRLAIRMEDSRIAEIRGVADNQNIDSIIANTTVLDDKLKEFGAEGEKYKKRSSDMKRLTEIEFKNNQESLLDLDELRFLYEIDSKIDGFGYDKDPRIEEIRNSRNNRRDLSQIFSCYESEISLTVDELITNKTRYHYGDIIYNGTTAKGFENLEWVFGNMIMNSLTSAVGFENLHTARCINMYSLSREELDKLIIRMKINRLKDGLR
jgi:hypothetical protein